MALSADQLNTIYQNVLFRNVDASGIQFFANRTDISDAQVRQQIELSSEATTFVTPIVRLYQEVLGRVPDAAGLKFFQGQLRSGTSLEAITQQFLSSTEFTSKTTATAGVVDATDLGNTTQLVTDAFTSILGRGPTSGEFAFFQGRSAANILSLVANSNEAAQVNAANVTTFLDSVAQGSPNGGTLGSQTGSGGTSNTGTTISLTTGTDNVPGTAGNDTINGLIDNTTATNSTLTAADTINGSAGTQDILNVTITGAPANPNSVTNGALVSGIEGVQVRNTDAPAGNAATLDASTTQGLTFFNSNLSTGDTAVTNAANGLAVGIIGNGTIVNGSVAATYVNAATSAAVTYANGTTGTGTVAVTGAGLTSATINSVGAANTSGTLTLAGTITAATINAATDLTVAGIADANLKTITISGAATKGVTLGALGAAVTTVDGSGLTTGGVTATLDAAFTSFKGGQGNDSITTNTFTTAAAASSINAGAGTGDKLVIGAAADVNTATKGAAFAGFEVLETTNQNVDLGNFANSTFTSLRVAGTETVTGINSTVAQNVTVFASGTPTLTLTGAANVGQIDTVKLTVDDGVTAVNTITLGNVNIAGVENLSITAVDKVTVSSLTGATALQSLTVTGSQDTSITTGNLNLNANTAVDASSFTGKLTFDASGAAGTNGIAITGGTGADTLTGTGRADIINGGNGNNILNGGAGNDTITGGTGNDSVAGGAGADTINAGTGSNKFFYGGTSAGVAATALTDSVATDGSVTVDTITGFVAGTDKFSVAATITAVSNAATATTASTGQALATDVGTALSNAGITGANFAANTAAVVTITGSGADAGTYVVINNGTAGFDAAADAVIKVVGLSGSLTAADFTTT